MSARIREAWQDPTIQEAAAKENYRNLPFHNFSHALDSREGVREEVELCRLSGDPMDPEEAEDAENAALWHDGGFYIPLHMHGFRSKEEFSKWIYGNEQRRLGMPEYRIERGQNFILGTEKGITPIGRGGKVVRRGDLRNVAHNRPLAVVRRSLDLFREDYVLKTEYDHLGEILTDPIKFVMGSYAVLSEFNEDDVSLGEFDIDPQNGVCKFTNDVAQKLPYFLEPAIRPLLKRLGVTVDVNKEAS